jgi:hypothetical protein
MLMAFVINSIENAFKAVCNLPCIMVDLVQRRWQLNRKITNQSTFSLAALLFILGIGLRYWVGSPYWIINNEMVIELLKEISDLVAAAGLVAIIWELSIRRTFFNEVMEKVGLATDVDKAGLISVTTRFYQDVDWQNLFRNTERLDILFSYGGTWRGLNTLELSNLANRGASVRVLLPNPANEDLMTQLGERYNATSQTVVTRIKEAEGDFHNKFSGERARNLEVRYINNAPVFDIYKFTDISILTLFSHRKGKTSVPALIVRKDGTLFNFMQEEFEAILADSILPQSQDLH